jgi:hypothetical protein
VPGLLELGPLLKWPAIIAGCLIATWGLYRILTRGRVAADDLQESAATVAAMKRAQEKMREAPKTPRQLADDLKRRFGLRDRQ